MSQTKIYNNVVDHRTLDNGKVVEDVTSIGLPPLNHTTNNIDVSGMAGGIDVPDTSHYEATEYSIAHNNGVNAHLLNVPGKHQHEFRIARQNFNVAKTEMAHESVKYRLIGLFKGRQRGNIERGNPTGYTDTYSLVRLEEEVNGKVVEIVDFAAGIVRHNGKDYSNEIQNLLK